jgi:CheY-like chemotaxis protein
MCAEWNGVMASSDKVVLVIEDIESNMRLFQHLLEVHGYNVLQAMDGLKAGNLRESTDQTSFSWISSCRISPASP